MPKYGNLKEKNFNPSLPSPIVVEVCGYSHQGEGVARQGKQVVFVKGGILGETLKIEFMAKQKGIFYARILDIIQASPKRINPLCSCFDSCGGCGLQHLAYPGQLDFKENMVKDLLVRLGKFDRATIEAKIKPIVAMDQPWHYRNKGVFHTTVVDKTIKLGFRAEGTHMVGSDICPHLFSQSVFDLLAYITKTINEPDNFAVFCNLTKLMIRESTSKGYLMVVLMVKPAFVQSRSLWQNWAAKLQEAFPLLKVMALAVDRGEINPIYNQLEYLTQATAITEQLAKVVYNISPASFFQVNTQQFEQILHTICQWLSGCRLNFVLDAYCGIGTIGLYLAKNLPISKLVGIEIVPSAVADAKANAKLNDLPNCDFILGKSEDIFSSLLASQKIPDVVVVDPPRKGCDPKLLQSVIDLKPVQVVYVSCNPATLARDLAILCGNGYEISHIQPVDVFAQSWHVETVVLLNSITS